MLFWNRLSEEGRLELRHRWPIHVLANCLRNILLERVPLVAVLVPPLSSMAAVSKGSHCYHGKVTGAPQNSMSAVNGIR